MEQDQIISSLFNMLQKSNNEKIKKEKEEQKDDWKVEIEKSEK